MTGGFTLSGGEPLMQHRFAVKLFTAARGMGIHTALDTNGYFGDRLTDDELEIIDLVLLDIKTWDPERHKHADRAWTSRRRWSSRGGWRRASGPIWLRFVLVPG